MNEKISHCSFCGKSQHDVKKLMEGLSVSACNECADLFNAIFYEIKNKLPFDFTIEKVIEEKKLVPLVEKFLRAIYEELKESHLLKKEMEELVEQISSLNRKLGETRLSWNKKFLDRQKNMASLLEPLGELLTKMKLAEGDMENKEG